MKTQQRRWRRQWLVCRHSRRPGQSDSAAVLQLVALQTTAEVVRVVHQTAQNTERKRK